MGKVFALTSVSASAAVGKLREPNAGPDGERKKADSSKAKLRRAGHPARETAPIVVWGRSKELRENTQTASHVNLPFLPASLILNRAQG